MSKRKTKPPMPARPEAPAHNLDESVVPRTPMPARPEAPAHNLDESVVPHKPGMADRFQIEPVEDKVAEAVAEAEAEVTEPQKLEEAEPKVDPQIE